MPATSNLLARILERAQTAAETNRSFVYRKHSITEELDDQNRIVRSTKKVYEVTLFAGLPFNRLTEIQGRKLTPAELAKEDEREAAFQERVTRVDFKKKARRRETIVTKDLLERFVFTVSERKEVNGRPALLLKFSPRPNPPDKTIEDKIYSHVSGTAWIDEVEAELVRLDASVQGPIPLGWFGAVGSLKSFKASMERVRMPDGAWLNSKNSFTVAGRKLFSSMHFRTEEVCSDFVKR